MLDNPKEIAAWTWIGTDKHLKFRIQVLSVLLPGQFDSRQEAEAAYQARYNPKGRKKIKKS